MQHAAIACRSCGQIGLEPILSLGDTPLANRLLTDQQLDEDEPHYPLELAICNACGLVQITETVPPEELFRDYAYFSSFSEGMLNHARDLTAQLIQERKLDEGSLAIEIASNDGYLLQFYKRRGVRVVGVEPAENVAEVARREHGVPTLCEFFGLPLAEHLAARGQRADVIHAHNVLAHVADLNGVVAGVRCLLKDDGVAVIEAPYVRDLVENVEFDTIYHEHLCYFSLTALDRLMRRHELTIADVRRIPLHGGSLQIRVTRQAERSTRVLAMLAEERGLGIDRAPYYRGFGQRVEKLRTELVEMLRDLKRRGRRIAVYGASAKGSTLLNYFGLGQDTLDFVVDRSTVKQGRYTPGTHLKICSPETLLNEQPDYCLLLTWNFADEILRQQDAYRRAGGRFIIPIPQVKVA